MAPKKDLAALRAREAEMAARVAGKRKRPAAPHVDDMELWLLKRGVCEDPVNTGARTVVVAPIQTPVGVVLEGISLSASILRWLYQCLTCNPSF